MVKLTILVVCVSSVGHANACIGATRPLLARGHRVIFLTEDNLCEYFSKYGFEEHPYVGAPRPEGEQKPGEHMAKIMVTVGLVGPGTAIEKIASLAEYYECEEIQRKMEYWNGAIVRAIEQLKPDLLYFDGNCLMPAVYYSAIPWINNISMSGQFYWKGKTLPPGGSGLHSNSHPDDWAPFTEAKQGFLYSRQFNDLISRLGYPRYPDEQRNPSSTAVLTVYATPKELNFPVIQSSNWFNLEVFNKPKVTNIQLKSLVPEDFYLNTLGGKWSGKWIYLSLGSLGSIDLELLKRLVAVLGTTNHKVIVSKGPRHAEYSLPESMYGDRFLPQVDILPWVDLVITHGGNNTVTETLAMGKPMIVFPLFADQFDNAQRLAETRLGRRMDANDWNEGELLVAIEELIYDETLKKQLKEMAKRIERGRQHEELAEKIEQLFVK